MYCVAWFQVAIHYYVAYSVFQIVLYSALKRTGTKLHIVTLGSHKFLSLVAQVYVITYLLYTVVQTLQLYVDNALNSVEIQLVEGNNLVQTIQELRRELLRKCLLHNVACVLLILIVKHKSCA